MQSLYDQSELWNSSNHYPEYETNPKQNHKHLRIFETLRFSHIFDIKNLFKSRRARIKAMAIEFTSIAKNSDKFAKC